MKEMEELAKALMRCNSFQNRKQCLNESLDSLSFNYPSIYPLMFREIKKRELEFNDPNKITKWINTSNPDSLVKLHEALMYVKRHNFMALEMYINILKQVFCHAIHSRTNVREVMKICCLIEKGPHLKIINEHFQYFIQQINLLYKKNYNRTENMQTNTFNQAQVVSTFRQLSIQNAPTEIYHGVHPSLSSFWSTLAQPINLEVTQSHQYLNQLVSYNYFGFTETYNWQYTANNFIGATSNLTIVNQEMDEAVANWLKYLKLHKYQWFFNALSYLEIECIDEDNIDEFVIKVNMIPIKNGAKKKICISTKTLRDRKQKLKDFMALDLDISHNELCEFMFYMYDILHYPIPNTNCMFGNEIQENIVAVMSKMLCIILKKLDENGSMITYSLLGNSINKYFECSFFITKNQMFIQDQIKEVIVFTKTLKSKVNLMPKSRYSCYWK